MKRTRKKENRTLTKTWKRDLLADTKRTGYSWRELGRKTVVNYLCPRKDDE